MSDVIDTSTGTAYNAKCETKRNERNIHGLGDQSGSGAHLYHKGIYLRCRPGQTQPVEAYDEWLANQLSDNPKGKPTITAAKLRRAVIMRKGGSTYVDCGVSVGMSGAAISTWLHKLPEGLAP